MSYVPYSSFTTGVESFTGSATVAKDFAVSALSSTYSYIDYAYNDSVVVDNLTFTDAQGASVRPNFFEGPEMRFADTDMTNYVAFTAPNTIATDVSWTLPSADGTNGSFSQRTGWGRFRGRATQEAAQWVPDLLIKYLITQRVGLW